MKERIEANKENEKVLSQFLNDKVKVAKLKDNGSLCNICKECNIGYIQP